MERVELAEPGRASLLTLMLKQILERSLQDPRKSQAMRGRSLTVRVRSRRMKTTLFFEEGRVRAEDGAHGRPDLEIAGEPAALFSVALGAGLLRSLLARRIEVRLTSRRGWICAFRMIPLLRVGGAPADRGPLARRKGGLP